MQCFWKLSVLVGTYLILVLICFCWREGNKTCQFRVVLVSVVF